jgi:hypothetical protein
MKMGPDVLGTAKNEYGRAKHENGTQHPQNCRQRVRARKTRKRDPSPPVPSKMSLGAQNIKRDLTTSLPPKTCPEAENMKTGWDALGTVKNESGRAKHENVTPRPRKRRKRVRPRKTRKRDPTQPVPSNTSPGA